jgi:hypothetical protein
MTSKAQRAITTTTLPKRNKPTTINAHLDRANTVFEWR